MEQSVILYSEKLTYYSEYVRLDVCSPTTGNVHSPVHVYHYISVSPLFQDTAKTVIA
jgi:hypothetical protein